MAAWSAAGVSHGHSAPTRANAPIGWCRRPGSARCPWARRNPGCGRSRQRSRTKASTISVRDDWWKALPAISWSPALPCRRRDSGPFVFAHADPEALEGKSRAAFRGGFLGVVSLGWSTLAQIVEASEADRDAL